MIKSDRFIIKSLEVANVSPKYLGWLNNQVLMKYLSRSKNERDITLNELKDYVLEKSLNPQIYFYGIFLKNTLEHIGNIKYEIEPQSQKYFMGILIGDIAWHGKGVAVEVIAATKKFDSFVNEIFLIVNSENIMAIKAYTKCGFKRCVLKNYNFSDNENLVMRLDTLVN
jgi:ribosomal-protein-alanine N-acetyltransferase